MFRKCTILCVLPPILFERLTVLQTSCKKIYRMNRVSWLNLLTIGHWSECVIESWLGLGMRHQFSVMGFLSPIMVIYLATWAGLSLTHHGHLPCYLSWALSHPLSSSTLLPELYFLTHYGRLPCYLSCVCMTLVSIMPTLHLQTCLSCNLTQDVELCHLWFKHHCGASRKDLSCWPQGVHLILYNINN